MHETTTGRKPKDWDRERVVRALATKDRGAPDFRAALRRATRSDLKAAYELRKTTPGERPERRAIALRLKRLSRKARLQAARGALRDG